MLTDLQRRKLNRMFEMYDVDKNGVVEQADYEQVVKNLASIYALAPKSAELDKVHAQHMDIWSNVRQLSSAPDKTRVTREEFIAGYEKILGGKAAFIAQMGTLADAMIAIADRNRDGKLSLKEYADNLRGFDMKLSEADALDTARRLDKSGGGFLTREDIARLVEEFFYSDDPTAPGNGLLGKY
jgi:Ca2+-binding EF-hand superfamily protein